MELRELIDSWKDLQKIADNNKLEIDVIKVFKAFEEQYKMCHGSNLYKPNYDEEMTKRYDWCLNCVNQVIESKIKYDIK